MSASNKIIRLLLLVCSLPLIASADVLMLKDGQTINGRFQGADQTSVRFMAKGQTRNYQISEINSITFTSSTSASATEGSGAEGRPTLNRRSNAGDYSEPAYSGPTPNPSADYGSSTSAPTKMNVTVHAGSVITVRMIDPVDSSVDQMGQTFRASLDEPLVVDGDTVVPRGADVTAKLTSKQEAGRIAGRSELTLVLFDITVNGQKREITTSEVTQSGSSRGKQTATRAGIGAVLGATIGAIAGGGKGAAIGAATGAGAGTAVQIMTHGEQVKIPAETRLDFTLAQPLNL